MPDSPKRIGIAADHGGFESKAYLAGMLRKARYEVVDFGDSQPKPDDDYPDFVAPLARAVACGEVDRGGRVVTNTVAWELVKIFLQARLSGAERHRRRVAKVARLGSVQRETIRRE